MVRLVCWRGPCHHDLWCVAFCERARSGAGLAVQPTEGGSLWRSGRCRWPLKRKTARSLTTSSPASSTSKNCCTWWNRTTRWQRRLLWSPTCWKRVSGTSCQSGTQTAEDSKLSKHPKKFCCQKKLRGIASPTWSFGKRVDLRGVSALQQNVARSTDASFACGTCRLPP